MDSHSHLPFFSAPLASALEQLSLRIQLEGTVHVISATTSLVELQKRPILDHVTIQKRPILGKRVTLRRTRNFRQTRRRVAYYPESQLDEVAMPILMYVTSGLANIYAGDYILTCRPGDFILIPTMVPKGDFVSHAVNDHPKSTCDILYIYPGQLLGKGLELWIARSIGEKIISSVQLGAALIKNSFLAALFTQLCKEIQSSTRNEIIHLLTESLVFFLSREILERRALLPDVGRHHLPTEHTHDPIKHALTYIESNLSNPLTIKDMARETALSTTSFYQLFQQETGTSFHRYLTDLRMRFAEKLLTETDLTVQEVAGRIGLSYSQLNRLIYTRHVCSPSKFRQKNKC